MPQSGTVPVKFQEELLEFHDFSERRCKSLRSTSPIESAFATNYGTRYSKGCLGQDWVLYMMFKLGLCAQKDWCCQRDLNYLTKVMVGVKFKDGIEVTQADQFDT